jgi:hypothetical protein
VKTHLQLKINNKINTKNIVEVTRNAAVALKIQQKHQAITGHRPVLK